ncbi:MAG: hypothetical protein WC322_06580 [Candidatus Paceibacterota bacterium]
MLQWVEDQYGQLNATGRHGHTFWLFYDHGWTGIIHNAVGAYSEHSIVPFEGDDSTFLRSLATVQIMCDRINDRLTEADNLPVVQEAVEAGEPVSGPGWEFVPCQG